MCCLHVIAVRICAVYMCCLHVVAVRTVHVLFMRCVRTVASHGTCTVCAIPVHMLKLVLVCTHDCRNWRYYDHTTTSS